MHMTRYQKMLVAVALVAWIWAAWHPLSRRDWMLENIPILILVPLILLLGQYFKFSSLSYTLMAVYVTLHVIGGHYTYSEVPFGYTLARWFGSNRNIYDRLVHFSFGLLFTYPIREFYVRLSKTKGFWGYYFPFDVVLAISAAFEIMEWLVATHVDTVLGLAFLGSQGDIWDTQKDMLMAAVGSLLALVIIFCINRIFDKNHFKDFWTSLRIPLGDKPMGEEGLKRLIKTNGKGNVPESNEPHDPHLSGL